MAEKEFRPLYESLAGRKIQWKDIPAIWSNLDLDTFSDRKTLYDFQVDAIKNGLKLLYRFESYRRDADSFYDAKNSFFQEINRFSNEKADDKELRIRKKDLESSFDLFRERYPVKERSRFGRGYEEIDFENFANRMGFWMATGSGKTLIAIKMVELLHKLMESGEIPDRDILLLTHREDILEQFEEEIEDYNNYHEQKIRTWDLKRDYSDVKKGGKILPDSGIDVFVYRSDLITEETKEKELSFEDIENNGKWYLLLDEAHKGKSSQSKRQSFFSMLTRNGFLFNFSATFTDPIDVFTTVFNFNIEKFSEAGYGKNVLLSKESLAEFTEEDFSEREKKKIVLESLIALTSQKQAKEKLDFDYHSPLLTCLVNSVNTKDSDLEVFFRALEEVAKEKNPGLFEEAKEEVKELIKKTESYKFTDEKVEWRGIEDIDKKDVLKKVFNAETSAEIEVKHTPENKQELVFKLKSSSEPFALMKIGSNTTWLKKKLEGYEVEEEYDFRSYFDSINEEESTINVLLGSRSFYEGWDSNRPNVLLFINLGLSSKRKFVMQALGRGLRIEPVENKRKRMRFLENVEVSLDKIADVRTLETLLVYGTSVDTLENIMEAVKFVKSHNFQDIDNIERNNQLPEELLVPDYESQEIEKIEDLDAFEGNKSKIKKLIDWLGDERLLFPHIGRLSVQDLNMILDFLEEGEFTGENLDPISSLSQLKRHINSEKRVEDGFVNVDDLIVHFKRMEADLDSQDDFEELESMIDEVRESEDPDRVKEELKQKHEEGEINLDEYTAQIETLKERNPGKKKLDEYDLNIEKIKSHFYNPILYTENENQSFFRNIIDVKSEAEFIKELSQQISGGSIFEGVDWWYFSKIQESSDEIFVPYGAGDKFYPDFIFWIKHGSDYHIVFVDPKSGEFTSYQEKVDGYNEVFQEDGEAITFESNGVKVRVHLKLFTDQPLSDISSEYYREYWINDVAQINPIN